MIGPYKVQKKTKTMRDKTVPSQLLGITLTIKYTYKANGYLKMYLIHSRQIKPLLDLQR